MSFRFGWKILADCNIIPYALPRFRLLAPLRGSTPRQRLVSAFALTWRCRSAQNDTDGSRVVGYNPKVGKVTLVISYTIFICTAEIPPAGAPTGFDSAAMFDFIA